MKTILSVIALFCVIGCSAQPSAPPELTFTRTAPFGTVPSHPSPPTTPPVVDRPLDASAYRTRLCDIFTNDQAAALGFPGAAEPRGSSEFIVCSRESKDPPIDLDLLYSTPELFSKVARGTILPFEFFKSVMISGQPALEKVSPGLDDVVRYCTIVLGLTNDQAIQIDVQDKKGSGACDRATKVAEAIVHNLGG